jgi:tRNA(adenine34) deaminase
MTDDHYMQQALKEAQRAFSEEEVPVGAIIVMNDRIIAKGYNQVEKLTDSTAHAEIIALTAAFNFLGSKYLPEAILYVTIEPCLMCSGALYWSKIGRWFMERRMRKMDIEELPVYILLFIQRPP